MAFFTPAAIGELEQRDRQLLWIVAEWVLLGNQIPGDHAGARIDALP